MSIDLVVYTALKTLAGGRVFPDIAEEGEQVPYITYQQVGGDAINYVEQTQPNKENARIQVNVWAKTRSEANSIAKQVEAAMRSAALQTTVLSSRISTYDSETKLRGTLQHFSVWSDA